MRFVEVQLEVIAVVSVSDWNKKKLSCRNALNEMHSGYLFGDCAKAFLKHVRINSAHSVFQLSKSDGAQKEVKYEPFSFPDGEYGGSVSALKSFSICSC